MSRPVSRRALLLAMAPLLLSVLPAGAQAQGGRAQLVVKNRSGAQVDVFVWRYNGTNWEWTLVTQVKAGFGAPISDVHENERFRAWVAAHSEHQYHTVRLARGGDGSAQDRWLIS